MAALFLLIRNHASCQKLKLGFEILSLLTIINCDPFQTEPLVTLSRFCVIIYSLLINEYVDQLFHKEYPQLVQLQQLKIQRRIMLFP